VTEKMIQEQLPLEDCIAFITESDSIQLRMVYARYVPISLVSFVFYLWLLFLFLLFFVASLTDRFIDEVYLDTENTLGMCCIDSSSIRFFFSLTLRCWHSVGGEAAH
jgi:hypothetical protein